MFDWDGHNLDHIALHRVEDFEAEEALLDPGRVRTGAYNLPHEKRRALIGTTEEGRVLLVVYTMRGERVRVVTARDASETEKRLYRRRKA